MATEPPAPSPAPTLDQHFPGYYPPTPSVMEDERTLDSDRDAASASATTTATAAAIQPETSASSATATEEEHPHETTNQERLIGAGKALLGAAAGFVVGGTVGAAAGAGLVGMTQVEQQGVDEQLHHSKDGEAAVPATAAAAAAEATTAATTSTNNTDSQATRSGDLDSHAAFGTPAVEKEQAELEHSPAQQLLAQADNSSHDKQKGEALLLAGGAGAHNIEHEVEVPGTETNVNDSEPPTPKASTAALMPDFGTPAVEKERSELEHSPAQQHLAEAASSSSAATPPLSAEAALLGAAAAGATAVGKPENEVEEPSTKPVDEAVVDDLKAGGGVPTNEAGQTGEVVTATPLGQETASTERPSLPTPSGSLESFSGAVLAAGSGIETPSVAPGPAVSGFGDRGSELIYLSDRDIDGNGAKESSEKVEEEGETATLPVDTPGARSDVSFPNSDQTEKPREERVHDTGLSIPPAGFVLADENAPKDFEPYTPPALPESNSANDDENDDTPHPTAAEKGKGRAFDIDETLAVAAAAGGGGFATAVGMKSFEREKTEEPISAPTSTFTENLDTPSISATAKDPLWDQRAELPPTAQVEQHEPHRALDPRALVAEAAPATSPEQAGFTGVAPGAEPTPAMQDFAHLSQPAPNADEAAMRMDPTMEHDESRRSEMVPVAAAAGMAGIGAGAASTRLLAREPAPMATPPRAAGGPASLSRFTEDTTRTGSPLEMGSTPSSTQAVMGSPAPHLQQGSPTPIVPGRQTSDVVPGSVVPQRFQQQGAPPQHVQIQPLETSNIERSPHMKIATNVVDGHKRLHRKSLSRGTPNSARSSGEFERPGPGAPAAFVPVQQPPVQALPAQRTQQPVMMPQQVQQPVMMQQQQALAPQSRFVSAQQPQPQVIPSNAAASGPTGAAGARPHVPAADAEARRDRMMDSMVGVRDPIVTGPPVGATIPAGAPAVTARILPSHDASLFPPAGPTRMESDASVMGERHNETRQGVPPMALGITAVTGAAIPGMATLPPVGGMPVSPQRQAPPPQQQQQMPVGAPSTIGSGRADDAGVQRKLSKKHPQEPVEKERKEGFFSKIFGGGSGRHSRESSQNSRNGVPVSPRNSSDLRRE